MDKLIAIDWSGNETAAGQRKHIWMAEWRRGAVSLTAGRSRRETIEAVTAAAHENPSLAVGFDFSFAFPAWFAREVGFLTAADVWRMAIADGDRCLRECRNPFWGRPRSRRPDGHYGDPWLGFRNTEREVARRTGKLPTSTFQIGGAGAVGTGSIRGMPHLLQLQQSGFSIWPFDPPSFPMAIEIYPRIFTGRTHVSNAAARTRHLESSRFDNLPAEVFAAARNSPDAFDALCALMGMVANADHLARLTQATDPGELLEGRIWIPPQM